MLAVALAASAAAAAEFNGSVQLATTATDNRGLQSDLLEQQYTLGLSQRLTPYITARLGYQLFDYTTSFEDGTDFTRRSSQPQLELLYGRSRLLGRLAFYQQTITNTQISEQDLTRRSLAANLGWRPANGPGFTFAYRRETNVADVAVFGRDVDSRYLDATAFYRGRHWTGSYSFEQVRLDNQTTSLQTDQRRHEGRFAATQDFWGRHFSLSVSGRLGRLRRTSAFPEGTELAEPVPASVGLFAVDTTPELGELDASPGLVDGDFETPVSPVIDVGGANTFRNIGLDVVVTREVSRLEIAVDTASGPSLSWQVYHSRDNLVWEAVPGVTAAFDQALLRYTLRFPATEDRYFKAVNVSVNPAPTVRVTEARALIDIPATGEEQTAENNLYRADVVADFRPLERIRGSVGFGVSNDEAITAGLVRRDYDDRHAFARLTFGLTRTLDFDLGYRYNDSENRRAPVLLRTVKAYNAGLRWRPLASVDALLVASRRDELEEATLLQSLESLRLGVVTLLLPDLRLVTDLDFARLDDPFAGRNRDSWSWRETLEMRPIPSWSVSGGFSLQLNETRAGEPLLKRTQYRLWTTWNPTPYLVLAGSLWYNRDDGLSSLNQSWSVSYTPGDRLSVSATYQGYDASAGAGTATDSFDLLYRLFNRFFLFANLSRSRTEGIESAEARISNLRAGLRLSF